MVIAKASMKHAYALMKDLDEFITFKKPKEFGGNFVGPFNYNWQALKPIDEKQLCEIINDPYNFRFAFWLASVSGVPDWVRQSYETYFVLADFLEKEKNLNDIPDRVFGAFRRVSGKESNYRNVLPQNVI